MISFHAVGQNYFTGAYRHNLQLLSFRQPKIIWFQSSPHIISNAGYSEDFRCCIDYVISIYLYRVFNLKVDRTLIWVIYLPRFITCYITQLTYIYSKCWKWCPFILMYLSTCFIMFLATFLSVLSFTSSMTRGILSSKF